MEIKKYLTFSILLLLTTVTMAQQPVVKWSPSPLAITPFSPKAGDLISRP